MSILCVTLVVLLTWNYDNGFDPQKDLRTVIGALLMLGGYDVGKAWWTGESKGPTEPA